MKRNYQIATAIYLLMLFYASLFPFQGWRLPEAGLLAWLAPRFPGHVSKSDLLVNVIAYLPLGFLLQRLWEGRSGRGAALMLAVLCGLAFSLSMELSQSALPSRVSSIVDLITNTLGTASGALAALLWQASAAPAGWLGGSREKHLLPGPRAEAGLLVLGCWALSQLAPFVPSLDLGGIKNALKPVWYTAHDLSLFDLPHAATYWCNLAALGIVARGSIRQRSLPLALFLVFAAAVLTAKIFVLGRQLSLEALSALPVAVVLWSAMSFFSERMRGHAATLLLLVGFAVYELKPVAGAVATVESFNWVPFRGQLARELSGFGTILEGLWPFAALSLLLMVRTGSRLRGAAAGGVCVFAFVFALEWQQITIPGRSADITQPLLALAGWLAPLVYLGHEPAD